jgi:hypothetical protein
MSALRVSGEHLSGDFCAGLPDAAHPRPVDTGCRVEALECKAGECGLPDAAGAGDEDVLRRFALCCGLE